VLYLDAENGEYEVHRRVHNLGLSPKHVAIYDAVGAHVVRDAEYISNAIRYERPDLVVLDSLRRLTPGTEENDSGAMADVVGQAKLWARDFNLALLFIHHARRDRSGYRGSSAIEDQVSISWEMKRADPRSDRRLRCLCNHKMRIGPEPADVWLRIEWDNGLCIVEAEPDDAAPLATGPQRSQVAADIVSLLEGKRGTRPQIAQALKRTTKDGTVRRALEELVVGGVVVQRDDGKYTLSPLTPPPAVALVANGTHPAGATPGATGDSVAPQVAKGSRT
jgi:predicted ATP-dependent serine protease